MTSLEELERMCLNDRANIFAPPEVTQDLQVHRLILHPANDWHPLNNDTEQFELGYTALSASGISSAAIEDGGDTQQLHDAAERLFSGEDYNNLEHAGAHFPKDDDIERPELIPDDFDKPLPDALQTSLRHCTVVAAGPTQPLFLPLSELENLVTERNVRQELKRSGLTGGLDKILLDVLRPQKPQTDTDITTTRRKIFAILCLMDRSKDIRAFIEEEIFDADLPFEFKSGRRVLRSLKKGQPGVAIRLFTHSNIWDYPSLDLFEDYQKRFMAPYFKLKTRKLRPYILHRCVILPFLGIEAKNGAYSVEIETLYSVVSRVEIHPAHHDYQSPHDSSDKMYFAVKQLQKTETLESAQANREIRAYKRVNSIHHAHIVRLLAIYAHLDRLHMIFPWADGNLYQFWETHFPDMSSLPRSHSLSKWMINQFHGLADGLRCIHRLEVDPALNGLQPEDKRRTHGRHGDIKPENILWFKSPRKESAMDQIGNLMISDLGSTDFHGTFSKDVEVHAAGGYTNTYRSPEFDFDKRITPESDIWSFGCVLLEFIVWYVLGWRGVQEFTDQRKEDSNVEIRSDHFFNFYKYGDKMEAKAKASVRQIFTALRENEASSDMIVDLLDLVESGLLRLRVTERSSCAEIVDKLQTIKIKCDESESYCVQKSHRDVRRTETDLSDNLVELQLSKEMKDGIKKNIDPNQHLRPIPSEATIDQSSKSFVDDDRSGTAHDGSDGTPGASGVHIKSEPPAEERDTLTDDRASAAQHRVSGRSRFRTWIRRFVCFWN
ncbi:hypothetical protein HBI56_030280 [Parastagonospora nodorum]|nr:hypothetical protein HBI09_104780 [Parastagonospora nodorum]KAH5010572.1 hypothetical protein HBI77_088310 [Parastagonospora nodorum]KAH5035249.1 hypothetical protein HBI74_061750 [Parastagonospora nodorum]KAH5085548.1 hypothetical protein HBH95_025140 [Parastagonospora nodorum]KAH5198726.1 hypothetical protein HBH76_020000 [Parastagonospora nodorum]